MRYKKYTLIVIMLLVVNVIFSQQKREIDNTTTNRVSDIFSYTNQISDFLVQQQANIPQIGAIMQAANPQILSNSSMIQQIGVDNVINNSTISNNSQFQYIQNGNNNLINSVNTIDNVNETVIQNGNNNRLINFSFGSVNEANLNVIQNGNNLTFEKFGTNELSNNLQFNIQGSARTITVRSFN